MRICSRLVGRRSALERGGNARRLRWSRSSRHEPRNPRNRRDDDERHDGDEDAHGGREHTRGFCAGAGSVVVLIGAIPRAT